VTRHRYVLALGSNVRHVRLGRPADVIRAALREIEAAGCELEGVSPIHDSAPMGPSRRRYANAAALVATSLEPEELLQSLKAIERRFGRPRMGRRWSARVLDLDIVLWSGGAWASPDLVIPHVAFREREFVLRPAASVAPQWRDPLTGLSVRQLLARLTFAHPIPR